MLECFTSECLSIRTPADKSAPYPPPMVKAAQVALCPIHTMCCVRIQTRPHAHFWLAVFARRWSRRNPRAQIPEKDSRRRSVTLSPCGLHYPPKDAVGAGVEPPYVPALQSGIQDEDRSAPS